MDPFIGQITLFPFNYAPVGWAMCEGQLLPIAQNTALFSLIGTYYGGNGTSNFALPDLRGRVPVGQGQGPGLSPYSIGSRRAPRQSRYFLAIAGARAQLPSFRVRRDRQRAGRGVAGRGTRFGARKHCDQQLCSLAGGDGRDARARAGRGCGRGPAAQQPAARPHPQLVHRAARHLPRPVLNHRDRR